MTLGLEAGWGWDQGEFGLLRLFLGPFEERHLDMDGVRTGWCLQLGLLGAYVAVELYQVVDLLDERVP